MSRKDIKSWLANKHFGKFIYHLQRVAPPIYKKGSVFKYPKVFQCDNGPEFKSEVINLLEKHNIDIRRATAKYKHTQHTFNKELAKLLFKPMDAQEFQDPE